MKYVVGIVYNKENVLLISKKRPAWQAGMLNGIGGKIEPGENPLQAMIRECKEECNLDIEDWVALKTVSFGKDETLTYFKAYSDMKGWKSLTDEEVVIISRDKFVNEPHLITERVIKDIFDIIKNNI